MGLRVCMKIRYRESSYAEPLSSRRSRIWAPHVMPTPTYRYTSGYPLKVQTLSSRCVLGLVPELGVPKWSLPMSTSPRQTTRFRGYSYLSIHPI